MTTNRNHFLLTTFSLLSLTFTYNITHANIIKCESLFTQKFVQEIQSVSNKPFLVFENTSKINREKLEEISKLKYSESEKLADIAYLKQHPDLFKKLVKDVRFGKPPREKNTIANHYYANNLSYKLDLIIAIKPQTGFNILKEFLNEKSDANFYYGETPQDIAFYKSELFKKINYTLLREQLRPQLFIDVLKFAYQNKHIQPQSLTGYEFLKSLTQQMKQLNSQSENVNTADIDMLSESLTDYFQNLVLETKSVRNIVYFEKSLLISYRINAKDWTNGINLAFELYSFYQSRNDIEMSEQYKALVEQMYEPRLYKENKPNPKIKELVSPQS